MNKTIFIGNNEFDRKVESQKLSFPMLTPPTKNASQISSFVQIPQNTSLCPSIIQPISNSCATFQDLTPHQQIKINQISLTENTKITKPTNLIPNLPNTNTSTPTVFAQIQRVSQTSIPQAPFQTPQTIYIQKQAQHPVKQTKKVTLTFNDLPKVYQKLLLKNCKFDAITQHLKSNSDSQKNKISSRTTIPKLATRELHNWLLSHVDHPYPTRAEKLYFVHKFNLTMKQVSTWFVNNRIRNSLVQTEKMITQKKLQAIEYVKEQSKRKEAKLIKQIPIKETIIETKEVANII